MTVAQGQYSHAEGNYTAALGEGSHTSGNHTVAIANNSFVFGEYNVIDTDNKYVEIVGNGKWADNAETRSNARALDWEGNEKLAGTLTLGAGTDDEVTITPAQLKALLALLS